MKTCRKCATTDPLVFSASQKTICKPCANAAGKAYRLADPEKNAARVKKWHQENPDRTAAIKKKYREANPDKNAAQTARYKAAKLQRTPTWVGKEFEALALEELYCCAQARTKATGVPHEVDHVLPMQGKKVSGFHLAANMQVITELENRIKSNRYEP